MRLDVPRLGIHERPVHIHQHGAEARSVHLNWSHVMTVTWTPPLTADGQPSWTNPTQWACCGIEIPYEFSYEPTFYYELFS